MATSFSVPKSPKRDVMEIDNFLGVDLTNTGSNISEMRSPNAPNMIRDVPGKVRKRMGYRVDKDFCEDEIVDDISYKCIPLYFTKTFPTTLTSTVASNVDYEICKTNEISIPKHQKFAVRIKYATSGEGASFRCTSDSGDRIMLANTGNSIVTKIFNLNSPGEEQIAEVAFVKAGVSNFVQLTIYSFEICLVSNNRQFDDSCFKTDTLTVGADSCFARNGIENILVTSTTFKRDTQAVYVPLKKNLITSGLKRIKVHIQTDNMASLTSVYWKNDIMFYASNKTTYYYVFTSYYKSGAAFDSGIDAIFYVDGDWLKDTDISYIKYYQWAEISSNFTVYATIQDADYINYATIRPVSSVPVFGAHAIKNTDNIDGTTLYKKNRFSYDFDAGNVIHETLSAGQSGKKYYFQDIFTPGEEVAYYIEYTASNDFSIEWADPDMYTRVSMKKGINVSQKIYKTFTTSLNAINIVAPSSSGVDVVITKFAVYHEAPEEKIPLSDLNYSKAPELQGETFNVCDLYKTSSNSITVSSAYSGTNVITIPSSAKSLNMRIAQVKLDRVLPKDRLYKVSCAVTVSSVTNISSIKGIYLTISFGEVHSGSNVFNNITVAQDVNATRVGNTYYLEGVANFSAIPNRAHNVCYVEAGMLEIVYTTTSGNANVSWSLGAVTIAEAIEKPKFLSSDEKTLVHVGKNLFLQDGINYNRIYSNMNQARSRYWQLENNVYIADGKMFLVFDSATNSVSEVYGHSSTYIPTLTIAKPTVNGTTAKATDYEAINLLNPAFKERFTSHGDTATYTSCQMSRAPLDTGSTVRAWVMDSSGNMVEKYNGTHFSVNYGTGTITFNYQIGNPPLTGEDNIIIQANRSPEGYKDRINKCRIGALFGVNGASDRLFLSGNPKYINYDWYSGYYDFTYFPDNGYSKLGLDTSEIVGYSIINNYLAAHKDKNEPTQGVIIREGDLIDNKPAFKIINTLQGEGAIAPYSFAYLKTEPLFLTRSGIFAITASDVTGEKYSQNRSFYLNGQLIQEPNLKDAFAIIYNDMYWLFVNNKAYILDGLQATQTDKGEPYATRQYVGFLLTNLPVNVAWENNDALWFGTSDGKVCRFFTDKEALESYSDNGKAIESWWETPDLDGSLFYKNKTFRYIAVRLKANIKTSAKLYSQVRGIWTLFKECKNISNIVFKFSEIIFSAFTFNNDTSDVVVSSKLRVKKIDKARFKIENSVVNEPFGIQNVALEYVESGNFKG